MIGDIVLGHRKMRFVILFHITALECNFFIMLLGFLKSEIFPDKKASQKKLF